MATIRQKRPGVWEVRAYIGRDENARPRQISRTLHGTKKEAQLLAAEMTLQRDHSSMRKVTVSQLLDLWFENQRATWAPSSEHNQASRVRQLQKDRISLLQIHRLSPVDVDRWHARLYSRGTGEGSVRGQHAVLRAAIQLAVRWGWVPTNVVAVAQLGRRKTVPRGTLTSEEVRAVISAAEDLVSSNQIDRPAALALRLAAVTGARRSELAALRWTDLRDSRLTVDSSIAVLRGATNRWHPELRDDPTKTANRREVALDDRTISMLDELRSEMGLYGPWILSPGDLPVNPERLSGWWRKARDLAGVAPNWRLHDLRHWSATVSIASGHDLRTVANRLGHANPSMTMRTYAHAVEAADAPVANTLGSLLD